MNFFKVCLAISSKDQMEHKDPSKLKELCSLTYSIKTDKERKRSLDELFELIDNAKKVPLK